MRVVQSYITFDGNCRDAMNFYNKALNASVCEMQTFGDSPVEVPEEFKNHIMHSRLVFDCGEFMASDNMPGTPLVIGNNISMSIGIDNEADAEIYFNNLLESGTLLMPFEKTFWGARFGMLLDQFGIKWMINCELN